MALVVIDSGNMEQVFAEANGEAVKSSHQAPPTKAEKTEAGKAEEKPEDGKTEDKAADGAAAKPEHEDDADDVEGDDGLTPRQKRELSAKMLKAIGKKHRQVKEAEEFAAHQIRIARDAERRAADAERELSQTRAEAKPEEQAAPVEPKRENFATEAEFIDARIQWGVDQGISRREAERQEEQRRSTVAAQLEKAAALVPDFEQVTSAPLNWPGPIAQYMRDSEMFAELGYHFAKNPAELAKIAALPPMKQLVAVGKIESTLQPFASRSPASEAKAGDKPIETDGKGAKPVPSTDTGFSPSKARSDAPVITPLNGDGRAVEPDPSSMTTREMIQDFQKSKGINFSIRKRH